MCLWSGRCALVHKLDTSVRPHPGETYRVPNLLCIIHHNGRHIPFLVEVKSSRKRTRRFSRVYCEKLQRYSDALGLPLLMAFKHTEFMPIWSLFDFQRMQTTRGTYPVDMVRHDLMGVLLGNFHMEIWEGTAISMTITKDTSGWEMPFRGTVSDVHWETPDGQHVDDDPSHLHWLFMLTEDEVEIETYADRVVQRFRKLGFGGAPAYWALGYAHA